jgi:putative serine protease PepD
MPQSIGMTDELPGQVHRPQEQGLAGTSDISVTVAPNFGAPPELSAPGVVAEEKAASAATPEIVPGAGIPGSNVVGTRVMGENVAGSDIPGSGAPGGGVPSSGMPGGGIPGSGVPGSGMPSGGVSGGGISGGGLPGGGLPGGGQPGSGAPGSGPVGSGQPAGGVSGSGIPGSGIPGSGIPGSGIPGSGVPGSGQPGGGVPSSGIAGSGVGGVSGGGSTTGGPSGGFGGDQPSPWSSAGYAYYVAGPGGAPQAQPQTAQPQSPQSAMQSSAPSDTAAPGYRSSDYPTYPSLTTQPHTQPTATYPVGLVPPDQRRRSPAGLIASVAVLALVVGGAAGGLGGYLVANNSDNQSASVSALESPAPASQTANAPAGSIQQVANQVLPVVVEIAAQSSSGNSGDTGSGFIISSDGNILTNNHVIAGAVNGGLIQVLFPSGKTVNATIVGRDSTTDIAVIKAQGVSGLPVAQLGRSDDLQVGQQVVAIGAPFELSGTVTSGIVSSLHRPTAAGDSTQNGQATVLDAIQTDAPINPGNSGGPLVDMQGRVVGINSAIYSPNTGSQQGSQGGNVGIGFAIPIDQAKRTADEIVRTGKATQTVLGVKVTDNTPSSGGQADILPNGALVTDVTPGGPADKAGVKPGAVVVKANNRAVSSADGLVAAVHAAAPGDQMRLTFSDGSSITVTLGGQPVVNN